MDVFDIFFPKVLCSIINSYVARCHDCNAYLINDYACTSCNRIRCRYCSFINSNDEVCVECQEGYKFPGYSKNIFVCISCDRLAYYGIADLCITYCWTHIPQNIIVYCYGSYCNENCVGMGIFINNDNFTYCSKHAKSYNGTLTRYTIIKD